MRVFRTICTSLLALLILVPCVSAQSPKQKKRKAVAKKASQTPPRIAVVGDFERIEGEKYTEEEDTNAEGDNTASKTTDTPKDASKSTESPAVSKSTEHSVTVTCDRPELVKGLPLRISFHDAELKLMRLYRHTAKFDDEGKCRIKLPDRLYQFEVLGGQGDVFVALRTASLRVTDTAEVAIKSAPPRDLSLLGLDGDEVPLRELAIRSAAYTGEVRWQVQDGDEPKKIRVALSPDQQYRVRMIGHSDETAYAIWREINSATQRLETGPRALATCKFQWASGGPSARRGGVTFEFPESRVDLPVTPETMLLTNRRFVTMFYWMETEAGQKIVFHRRGYTLPAPGGSVTLDLGGPLQPVASGVVVRYKPEPNHLLSWFFELRDARGHFVDDNQSSLKPKATLRRRGSGDVSPSELHGPVQSLNELLGNLEVAASYEIDGSRTEQVVPLARSKPKHSQHFTLHAPESWDWLSECYLAKCERIWRMTYEATGRNLKTRETIKVRWHAAGTSLGSTVMVSLPLAGLRRSLDFYQYPRAIGHEIHHAFGYGHGDAMSHAGKLTGEKLRAYRWHMADHPELLPEHP